MTKATSTTNTTGAKKPVGHSLGKTIAEEKWRCKVCTFLNDFDETFSCKRCREPVTEDSRSALRVPFVKVIPEEKKTAAKPVKTSSSSTSAKKVSESSAPASAWPRKEGTSSSELPHPSAGPKKGNKIVSNPNAKPTPKLNQQHKGDIGYAASKSNIHTFVRSKLNHATASYVAKLPSKESDTEKKGAANVVTLNSMVKNGFVASPSVPKSTFNRHDETAAPRPAKYEFGKNNNQQKSGGLISYLQSIASADAVASLKNSEHKTSAAPVAQPKPMGDGTYSKFSL